MQEWWKQQTILMIVAIIILIFVALIFIFNQFKAEKQRKEKYTKVLYPDNTVIEKELKIKKKSKFNSFLDKKGINDFFTKLYIRMGKTGKDGKDFFLDMVKFFFIAVALVLIMYYVTANILIALFIGIVVFALPPLNLYSKIKSRESSFRNDFPYFLQTVAFVLKNGTNFSQAFYEVTQKQEETVLKEVMLDVVKIQNIYAGDYKIAFQSITEKIKIQEVAEFVNIVIDNMEKGVSVADTFLNQAQNISKILNLSIKKKISAVSTKILLPILIMCASLGILFITM